MAVVRLRSDWTRVHADADPVGKEALSNGIELFDPVIGWD